MGDLELKKDVSAAPLHRNVETLLELRHGMDPF